MKNGVCRPPIIASNGGGVEPAPALESATYPFSYQNLCANPQNWGVSLALVGAKSAPQRILPDMLKTFRKNFTKI